MSFSEGGSENAYTHAVPGYDAAKDPMSSKKKHRAACAQQFVVYSLSVVKPDSRLMSALIPHRACEVGRMRPVDRRVAAQLIMENICDAFS
jgi:hypothetical protein